MPHAAEFDMAAIYLPPAQIETGAVLPLVSPVGTTQTRGRKTLAERLADPRSAGVLRALERRRADLLDEETRVTKPRAKNYTTDYAIKWAEAQGWRLLERERYDVRTKRHHDLMLGSDAMCLSPNGVVLLQGAGVGERPLHRKRFEERGGEKTAQTAKMTFLYIEFKRDLGHENPVRVEQWA